VPFKRKMYFFEEKPAQDLEPEAFIRSLKHYERVVLNQRYLRHNTWDEMRRYYESNSRMLGQHVTDLILGAIARLSAYEERKGVTLDTFIAQMN